MSDTLIPTGSAAPDYVAAGQGRRLRTWRPSSSGPNAVMASVETVRQRSRAAGRNDPWAAASADKSVSNGIGTGIQAKQVNGTPAEKEIVRQKWNAFCRECDSTGVFHFYAQQAMMWREWDEGGEIFVRLRSRRASDGLAVPLQLQLIEAEQVPTHHNAFASNGNVIRNGIEFSKIGRRVAYWVYREHPGDDWMQPNAGELVRVPADEMLHLYTPLRAGQNRGMPIGTSALVRMYNLDRLEDAVLDRQQVANLFSVFFTSDAGTQTDPITGQIAPGTASDGVAIGGMEPGTGIELPPGVKPVFSSPPDAGSNYSDYLRSQLMAIAAARGLPYEVLTGDLRDVSDRALKLILNEFRRVIEQRQWLYFIPQVLHRVREAFFDAAVLSGALILPDYATRRNEYTDTLWVPQGWPWSHPVQDVTAEKAAVRAGFKSRSAVRLGAGDDPEEVDSQIIEDNATADRNGFVFDSDPRRVSAEGVVQGPAEDAEQPPENQEQTQ